MLACVFLLLLKPLKPEGESSLFRAIAGSSLILKQVEKTFLENWGSLLQSDSLQFGYKRGASITKCTWLVQEVVQRLPPHCRSTGLLPSFRIGQMGQAVPTAFQQI